MSAGIRGRCFGFYEVKSRLPQEFAVFERFEGSAKPSDLAKPADLEDSGVFECFGHSEYSEHSECSGHSEVLGESAVFEPLKQVLPQAVPEVARAVQVSPEAESAAGQVFDPGALLGVLYKFHSALRAVRFLRHRARSDERRLYFDFYYFRSLESPFCRLSATQIF